MSGLREGGPSGDVDDGVEEYDNDNENDDGGRGMHLGSKIHC